MKTGWLVNDQLTAIPGTKTFWHQLLECIPGLEDKCNGYTDYSVLPDVIEAQYKTNPPDYIIRNASFFRKLQTSCKTISFVQDYSTSAVQLDAINSSDVAVFNSLLMQHQYKSLCTAKKSLVIPIGTDFEHFHPMPNKKELQDKWGILPNSVLFIGSADHIKGYDILKYVIENTPYNYCLVMKDSTSYAHSRVRVFNRVTQDQMVEIMNACSALICTSRFESLHLAGVEAGACGLPVVTKPIGIYWGESAAVHPWGVYVGNDNYIGALDLVMGTLSQFSPRKAFLDRGLVLNTMKQEWNKLVETLWD
jgi:glycosyltransferase involved in cell wall biosynthesis